MNLLITAQLVLNGVIAIAGIAGNIATIIVFKWTKTLRTTLDPTTLTLMLHVSSCNLVLCLITILLRIWNVGVGAEGPFYDQSFACWLYVTSLATSYVTAWLMLSLALTRLLATFKPHKYETWLRMRTVRWVLYLIPWTFGYAPQLLFGLAHFYKAAPDKLAGGLCVNIPYERAPLYEKRLSVFAFFITIFQIFTPLAIGTIAYVIIFLALWKRNRNRNRQVSASANTRQPVSVQFTASSSLKRATGKIVVGALNGSKPVAMAKEKLERRRQERTSEKRRLRCVKVLAWSYFAFIFCLVPRPLIFGMLRVPRTQWLFALMEVLLFFSSCVSPMVYVLTMRDVRVALRLAKVAGNQTNGANLGHTLSGSRAQPQNNFDGAAPLSDKTARIALSPPE